MFHGTLSQRYAHIPGLLTKEQTFWPGCVRAQRCRLSPVPGTTSPNNNDCTARRRTSLRLLLQRMESQSGLNSHWALRRLFGDFPVRPLDRAALTRQGRETDSIHAVGGSASAFSGTGRALLCGSNPMACAQTHREGRDHWGASRIGSQINR